VGRGDSLRSQRGHRGMSRGRMLRRRPGHTIWAHALAPYVNQHRRYGTSGLLACVVIQILPLASYNRYTSDSGPHPYRRPSPGCRFV